MMYHMRNIVTYEEALNLPKCMYHVKNPNESLKAIENDINICDQGPNKKMTELEQRQDQLLKKLDILYDRIKTIGSLCKNSEVKTIKSKINTPNEAVLNLNPDSLPFYLNVFLKSCTVDANITWHIHSSVPNEKIAKINAFVKRLSSSNSSIIHLRLIFKCVSADPNLKLSSLAVPIVGNVNILRYLSLVYPDIVPYDCNDYKVDGLLDLCHLLERTPDKDKEALILKLFLQSKDWIYNNQFSIVDVAAYNVIKQLRSKPKSIPKEWFARCEKLCLL